MMELCNYGYIIREIKNYGVALLWLHFASYGTERNRIIFENIKQNEPLFNGRSFEILFQLPGHMIFGMGHFSLLLRIGRL